MEIWDKVIIKSRLEDGIIIGKVCTKDSIVYHVKTSRNTFVCAENRLFQKNSVGSKKEEVEIYENV